MKITVNGVQHDWFEGEITYTEIVYMSDKFPELTYTITFTKGHAKKPQGILFPGNSIRVKGGMSFTVAFTGDA